MSTDKKIAFWGTPEFTVEFLETLKAQHLAPRLVITNPDRPVGRGHTITAPAPALWAKENTISVLQPEKIDDAFFEALSKTDWDLFVVVAYGKILPEKVISLPRFGTINVHYSLLPNYRGATPVESAILAGDTETGITIQQMNYELDSGDILGSEEIPIADDDTAPSLRAKLNAEALELLPEIVEKIFSNEAVATPQTGTITKCGKTKKEDGLISLSDDPIELDRKFRAYQPWPSIYFDAEKNGQKIRVKITKAHLENNTFVIDEVIPENRGRMSFDAFQKVTASH